MFVKSYYIIAEEKLPVSSVQDLVVEEPVKQQRQLKQQVID